MDAYLVKGVSFERQTDSRFLKDVLYAGRWVHPATAEIVDFPPERVKKIVADTNRWMGVGNKVRLTWGHPEADGTFKKENVLGDWPEGFIVLEDRVWGVAGPKDAETNKKMENKSLDSVSIGTRVDVLDQKGNKYPEIIDHVALTPFPVVTKQGEFVALSEKLDQGNRKCFVPEALSQESKGVVEMELKTIAGIVGLADTATEADVTKKIEEMKKAPDLSAVQKKARETVLASIGTELGTHGLTLSIDGEKLSVAKSDEKPKPKTDAEKKLQERLDGYDAKFQKELLGKVTAQVEALISEGKIPPSQEDDVRRLLSISGQSQSLMLSGDPKKIQKVACDAAELAFKIFSAIPSVHESKLSQLATHAPKDGAESNAKKNVTLAETVASRVGETHSADAAKAAVK